MRIFRFEIIRKLAKVFSNTINEKVIEFDRKGNDGLVLKVMVYGKTMAYLSSENDESVYTLRYTKDFLKFNIPSFHLRFNEKPNVGEIYESKFLWLTFSERIPDFSVRLDAKQALEDAGLSIDSPRLEILGRIFNINMSSTLVLELVYQKSA